MSRELFPYAISAKNQRRIDDVALTPGAAITDDRVGMERDRPGTPLPIWKGEYAIPTNQTPRLSRLLRRPADLSATERT
jgi:hypothetical protein